MSRPLLMVVPAPQLAHGDQLIRGTEWIETGGLTREEIQDVDDRGARTIVTTRYGETLYLPRSAMVPVLRDRLDNGGG